MSFENISIQYHEAVAILTIQREAKLNALNIKTINELNKSLLELFANAEVRCIVLTGAGSKAFVAGADISEFAHFNAEEGKNLSRVGHDKLFNLIENGPKPVIAAINGFALGGGLELALACHIRLASENAKLGLPEVGLGVIPGYGGTQRLAMNVSKGKAMEMILTAKMVEASEARDLGLVSAVFSQDTLLDASVKMATAIARNAPLALKAAITSVNALYKSEGFEEEINQFGNCFGTEDFKEGTQAFLEKRKPVFKGK